ncbi:MAG: hypothetical protein Q8R16_03960 [bacterium]|nr:hypothetical protein [bacterium]
MYRTRKLPKKSRPGLAVDFDGVIHRYRLGFHDGSIYDVPMEGAKRTLERLHKDWWLYIYTTRAKSLAGRRAVGAWLRKHGIPFDEVVGSKPIAFAYIDDRAIRFVNWRQASTDLKRLYATRTR